jgi:fructokinase
MRIGIDLGGTKIEAIALDEDGSVLLRERIAAPRDDYDATLDAIAGLVESMERRLGRTGTVGVGMPGTISPATGLVKNANSTWLNGRAFADDLPRRLSRPVRFVNDANCFTLSEAVDGAAARFEVVFGVILGTGVGGGIAVRRKVLSGRNGIAGEWGHNPLPWAERDEWPGASCYCGRSGCIETFLSGPGLTRDFASGAGEKIAATAIAVRAEQGDARAKACLDRYVNRLARALASVINVLDPDAIVLGGGVSNIERLYSDVPAQWARFIFSDRVDTVLLRAAHGDSSGVRGAAWLW